MLVALLLQAVAAAAAAPSEPLMIVTTLPCSNSSTQGWSITPAGSGSLVTVEKDGYVTSTSVMVFPLLCVV